MGRYALRFLIGIAVLAWGGLIVEVVIGGVGIRMLAALAAVVAPVCASLYLVAVKWVAATHHHATRIESALDAHSDVMAKQILTIERFFGIGVKSDLIARMEAADSRSANGTGPFRQPHNHLGRRP